MLSRGAEEKDIVDEADPACGDKLRSLAPSWLVTSEGHLTAEGGDLITINDLKPFSRERDRERAIKRVFAKHISRSTSSIEEQMSKAKNKKTSNPSL